MSGILDSIWGSISSWGSSSNASSQGNSSEKQPVDFSQDFVIEDGKVNLGLYSNEGAPLRITQRKVSATFEKSTLAAIVGAKSVDKTWQALRDLGVIGALSTETKGLITFNFYEDEDIAKFFYFAKQRLNLSKPKLDKLFSHLKDAATLEEGDREVVERQFEIGRTFSTMAWFQKFEPGYNINWESLEAARINGSTPLITFEPDPNGLAILNSDGSYNEASFVRRINKIAKHRSLLKEIYAAKLAGRQVVIPNNLADSYTLYSYIRRNAETEKTWTDKYQRKAINRLLQEMNLKYNPFPWYGVPGQYKLAFITLWKIWHEDVGADRVLFAWSPNADPYDNMLQYYPGGSAEQDYWTIFDGNDQKTSQAIQAALLKIGCIDQQGKILRGYAGKKAAFVKEIAKQTNLNQAQIDEIFTTLKQLFEHKYVDIVGTDAYNRVHALVPKKDFDTALEAYTQRYYLKQVTITATTLAKLKLTYKDLDGYLDKNGRLGPLFDGKLENFNPTALAKESESRKKWLFEKLNTAYLAQRKIGNQWLSLFRKTPNDDFLAFKKPYREKVLRKVGGQELYNVWKASFIWKSPEELLDPSLAILQGRVSQYHLSAIGRLAIAKEALAGVLAEDDKAFKEIFTPPTDNSEYIYFRPNAVARIKASRLSAETKDKLLSLSRANQNQRRQLLWQSLRSKGYLDKAGYATKKFDGNEAKFIKQFKSWVYLNKEDKVKIFAIIKRSRNSPIRSAMLNAKKKMGLAVFEFGCEDLVEPPPFPEFRDAEYKGAAALEGGQTDYMRKSLYGDYEAKSAWLNGSYKYFPKTDVHLAALYERNKMEREGQLSFWGLNSDSNKQALRSVTRTDKFIKSSQGPTVSRKQIADELLNTPLNMDQDLQKYFSPRLDWNAFVDKMFRFAGMVGLFPKDKLLLQRDAFAKAHYPYKQTRLSGEHFSEFGANKQWGIWLSLTQANYVDEEGNPLPDLPSSRAQFIRQYKPAYSFVGTPTVPVPLTAQEKGRIYDIIKFPHTTFAQIVERTKQRTFQSNLFYQQIDPDILQRHADWYHVANTILQKFRQNKHSSRDWLNDPISNHTDPRYDEYTKDLNRLALNLTKIGRYDLAIKAYSLVPARRGMEGQRKIALLGEANARIYRLKSGDWGTGLGIFHHLKDYLENHWGEGRDPYFPNWKRDKVGSAIEKSIQALLDEERIVKHDQQVVAELDLAQERASLFQHLIELRSFYHKKLSLAKQLNDQTKVRQATQAIAGLERQYPKLASAKIRPITIPGTHASVQVALSALEDLVDNKLDEVNAAENSVDKLEDNIKRFPGTELEEGNVESPIFVKYKLNKDMLTMARVELGLGLAYSFMNTDWETRRRYTLPHIIAAYRYWESTGGAVRNQQLVDLAAKREAIQQQRLVIDEAKEVFRKAEREKASAKITTSKARVTVELNKLEALEAEAQALEVAANSFSSFIREYREAIAAEAYLAWESLWLYYKIDYVAWDKIKGFHEKVFAMKKPFEHFVGVAGQSHVLWKTIRGKEAQEKTIFPQHIPPVNDLALAEILSSFTGDIKLVDSAEDILRNKVAPRTLVEAHLVRRFSISAIIAFAQDRYEEAIETSQHVIDLLKDRPHTYPPKLYAFLTIANCWRALGTDEHNLAKAIKYYEFILRTLKDAPGTNQVLFLAKLNYAKTKGKSDYERMNMEAFLPLLRDGISNMSNSKPYLTELNMVKTFTDLKEFMDKYGKQIPLGHNVRKNWQTIIDSEDVNPIKTITNDSNQSGQQSVSSNPALTKPDQTPEPKIDTSPGGAMDPDALLR